MFLGEKGNGKKGQGDFKKIIILFEERNKNNEIRKEMRVNKRERKKWWSYI